MTEPALAPALMPTLQSSVSPTSGLHTGDLVTLKLSAFAKNGVDLAVPEQTLAPFELVDKRATIVPKDGGKQFTFELDLLILDPGQHTLPALSVRVVGPKGELAELKTPSQTLTVSSLLANEPNAAPKPATKPVVVMQDDYTLAYVGGGVLALALLILATLFVQRWLGRRPKILPPPPPPRPAWEVALEKLEQLRRRKESLLAAERGEELVDSVSEVLREYLGKRYGFDGLESTSDEILTRLETLRPHRLSLSGVQLLLAQCDLVKFARLPPDPAQCDDLFDGVQGMIRATTPPQTPASEAARQEART